MSRTRCLATQCHTDCPCSSGRLTPTSRLGGIYGCSNPSFSRKPGASGIYFMGSVCTKERGFYRPQQAFGSDICTPFAAFCLPRLFRKQTFQPRKRISDSAWRRTNQMVKLTYRYEKSRRIVFRGSFHIIAQQMYINTR